MANLGNNHSGENNWISLGWSLTFEGKNILIRIVDGNDQVIFDVARGSGTFMLGGKEEFYTANQEILFDNTRQQLAFEYEKGTEYESGLYTLEVYTDDYRMGSGQFVVKWRKAHYKSWIKPIPDQGLFA